jgi:uncharacterized membrane protein
MALRIARWLGIAALVIGYPLLAHYTNASVQLRPLGAAVAIAPVAVLALVLAWRSTRRGLMLSLLALLCAGLWMAWPLLAQNFEVIYWLQHAGMQLLLFVFFGRTLIAGRVPLCTRFARIVHAPATLAPSHERYARLVTLAWTVFFAVIGITSTLLFFLAPLSVWSVFANFLTPLLVAVMFIAEYAVRYRLLPHAPRTHILDAVRAFMGSGGQPR